MNDAIPRFGRDLPGPAAPQEIFAPKSLKRHKELGMSQAVESDLTSKTGQGASAPSGKGFQKNYLRAYKAMLCSRLLEDKLASLYRGGKIHGGVYLGRGQEALSAAIGVSLEKGDIFAPLIRDGAGRLAFGEPLVDAIRTCLGSAHGPMRGRDGNVHRGRPSAGVLAMISHLGAMISVTNGILLARRMKGISGTVGVSSIGEGATSTGSFHEALNQAAVEKLPLVVVVANNQYAYSTPTSRQFACRCLVDRARGYGVTGHTNDGTDLKDCLQTVDRAVSLARRGQGPQMVVAQFLRLCGHGEHDDYRYLSPQLKDSPVGRDCLEVAEQYLRQQHWAEENDLQAWRRHFTDTMESVLAKVQQEPGPDPYQEDWRALASRHLMDGFDGG